jgi:hypothetical protein
LAPKPSLYSTSKRYGHEIELNAFAMSNFIKIAGTFFLCSSLAMLWTSIKLS